MTAIAEASSQDLPISQEAAEPSSASAGLRSGVAWLSVAAATIGWPDKIDFVEFGRTTEFAILTGLFGLAVLLAGLGGSRVPALGARIIRWMPWLLLSAGGLLAWQILTAKLGVLPMPFFPPPQSILEVFIDDWPRMLNSVWHSALLLAGGFAIGAAAGFVTGVAVGWSRTAGYWVHPLLRFIGPLPATAWLPLAFFIFPSSGSAANFLVALATWFPVTVLTWSGVVGINKAYYDVARTLGASERFLIFKVAIPAALPHLFVGLFMGLGSSFSVLVVAEMLGVKAGLGWYLQWAQGWAAYANMYAALIVLALSCSGLITLLFRIRDRTLSWQKDLVQW